MKKKETTSVSVRFERDHLAYLLEALQQRGDSPKNLSHMIKLATVTIIAENHSKLDQSPSITAIKQIEAWRGKKVGDFNTLLNEVKVKKSPDKPPQESRFSAVDITNIINKFPNNEYETAMRIWEPIQSGTLSPIDQLSSNLFIIRNVASFILMNLPLEILTKEERELVETVYIDTHQEES